MIGSGYVGLVSGACFSDFGHDVICVDKDEVEDRRAQGRQDPIFEPGLEELVARNVQAGRLSFTTDLAEAAASADAIFIAVGTPSRRGDGYADLSYVHAAAAEIAEVLQGFTVIVNKSTVPVGTGDDVERIIARTNPNAEFAVVSNPEFLREGAAIDDFKHPDRIVIGGSDERGMQVMREVYRPLFLGGKSPMVEMSRRGAELTKYAGNAFLATKITFINEIADLCERWARTCAMWRADRAGQPDRQQVPECRAGVWRKLLPQGHDRPAQDRAGFRSPATHRGGGCRGQRSSQAGDGAQGDPGRRGRCAGQAHRDPGPHLQAQHRRHARFAVDRDHPGLAGCRCRSGGVRSGGRGAGARSAGRRAVRLRAGKPSRARLPPSS
jgi:hypothetical protein